MRRPDDIFPRNRVHRSWVLSASANVRPFQCSCGFSSCPTIHAVAGTCFFSATPLDNNALSRNTCGRCACLIDLVVLLCRRCNPQLSGRCEMRRQCCLRGQGFSPLISRGTATVIAAHLTLSTGPVDGSSGENGDGRINSYSLDRRTQTRLATASFYPHHVQENASPLSYCSTCTCPPYQPQKHTQTHHHWARCSCCKKLFILMPLCKYITQYGVRSKDLMTRDLPSRQPLPATDTTRQICQSSHVNGQFYLKTDPSIMPTECSSKRAIRRCQGYDQSRAVCDHSSSNITLVGLIAPFFISPIWNHEPIRKPMLPYAGTKSNKFVPWINLP